MPHPRRQAIHDGLTRGDRVAIRVAGAIGSWPFIGIQSAFLAAWIVVNTVHYVYHWDGYPYILLNLFLSFQAAYTGPVLLIANNVGAKKDHLRDDLEAQEVELEYQESKQHSEILTELRTGWSLLHQINEQQLEILRRLDGGTAQKES